MAPDRPLVERFRKDLLQLSAEPGRLALAVSGGPDSLAMLLLAAAALPGEIEAATVDHGLRAEGAAEAEFAAGICERLGCPHAILKIEVPEGPAGLQGEARRARYSALRDWAGQRGLSSLLTAHHANDQAETILMRLKRGSGLSGLSGVRPVRADGSVTVLRPLLGWSRGELLRVVAASGISAVEDPSNNDERFDRVKMRQFLAANPDFEPRRLARSAAALAEAEEALGYTVRLLAAERCSASAGSVRIDISGLPRELRRRLLGRAISEVRREAGISPNWTGSEDLEGLMVELEAGRAATRAGVLARSTGELWHVSAAPPRRPVRVRAAD